MKTSVNNLSTLCSDRLVFRSTAVPTPSCPHVQHLGQNAGRLCNHSYNHFDSQSQVMFLTSPEGFFKKGLNSVLLYITCPSTICCKSKWWNNKRTIYSFACQNKKSKIKEKSTKMKISTGAENLPKCSNCNLFLFSGNPYPNSWEYMLPRGLYNSKGKAQI